jgi:hypothetical protein
MHANIPHWSLTFSLNCSTEELKHQSDQPYVHTQSSGVCCDENEMKYLNKESEELIWVFFRARSSRIPKISKFAFFCLVLWLVVLNPLLLVYEVITLLPHHQIKTTRHISNLPSPSLPRQSLQELQ